MLQSDLSLMLEEAWKKKCWQEDTCGFGLVWEGEISLYSGEGVKKNKINETTTED